MKKPYHGDMIPYRLYPTYYISAIDVHACAFMSRFGDGAKEVLSEPQTLLGKALQCIASTSEAGGRRAAWSIVLPGTLR